MTTGLILTLVKYAFSALLTFISIACTKNIKYTVSSLLELACIFLIVNTLLPAARGACPVSTVYLAAPYVPPFLPL